MTPYHGNIVILSSTSSQHLMKHNIPRKDFKSNGSSLSLAFIPLPSFWPSFLSFFWVCLHTRAKYNGLSVKTVKWKKADFERSSLIRRPLNRLTTKPSTSKDMLQGINRPFVESSLPRPFGLFPAGGSPCQLCREPPPQASQVGCELASRDVSAGFVVVGGGGGVYLVERVLSAELALENNIVEISLSLPTN